MDKQNSNNTLEVLADGLKRQLYDNGQIVVYTLETTRRETIDTWAEIVIDRLKKWPEGKPYLVIHDASRIFLTPHLRIRSQEIAETPREDVQGAYAVVLPSSVVGQLMKLFVRRKLAANKTGRQANVFTSLEEALIWLREIQNTFASH